ncbi:MAG: hypothetical protein H7172_06580 [Ferruginibacter sp.]|nr:hypothetical protein [Rhodoferax sp.]
MLDTLARSAIDPAHTAFLQQRGTRQTAHSGHTLWAHLTGVHQILVRWGAARPLQLAGLFHSVYGTQVFATASVAKTERASVIRLIGEPAETLVWLFAHLQRPTLFETSLRSGHFVWPHIAGLPPLQSTDHPSLLQSELLALECANLVEQRTLYKFPHLSRHAQVIGMLDADGFSV